MDGILILDKPRNQLSARYVYRLRPILGIRRVGHAGSLDPFARGVLIAGVGRGCKCTEMIMGLPKHYEATVQLGVTNDCYDTERPLQSYPDARQPDIDEVREALGRFCGEIQQVPPAHSAVKIDGVPAYRLARRKEAVTIRPRPVRIYSMDLREYAWPMLRFDLWCGRGTYIRSIVRDLGQMLGCGAVCMELRRTAIGPFDLSRAIRLEDVSNEKVADYVIPVEQVKRMVEQYEPPG